MTRFVETTLRTARQALRSGDLPGAEASYRRVLERDPAQAESLHQLGRLALRAGRDAEAASLLERALEASPFAAATHADLAAALQNLGRNEAAAGAAGRALAIQPDLVTAHNTLGNALRGLNRPAEAVDSFRRALALDDGIGVLHLNLAAALREAGRPEEGIEACARALAQDSSSAHAHFVMGTLCRDLGRGPEAERHLREAVALRPAHVEARLVLGDLLRAEGRLDESRESLAGAVERAPAGLEGRVRLAQVCAELARPEEAAEHFSAADALRPDHPEILSGLGNALRLMGRIDEATAAYRRAVAIRPEFAEGWCNLATADLDRGRLDDAETHSRLALAAAPDLAEAQWNLAQALLARGDLARGWRKYESRRWRANAAELEFPHPPWDGMPLASGTLLITAEQGIGDEILFASCLPDAIGSAGRCVVECDARLVPLFARSFPQASFFGRLAGVTDYPAALPKPDACVAIGSLPMRFREDESQFPERSAYLVPDSQAVRVWRERYAALGPGLKVGISWRGGKEILVQRARSTKLAQWAGLGRTPGVRLVNLQYGDCDAELREAREQTGLEIHDWEDSDPLTDMDGFAAQIAALDFVISVDNSTVHLAGAVGTPAWVLLPATADWRWMTDREDSPWYPSLRLFRQEEPGNWEALFARVAAELGRWAAGPASGSADERVSAGPDGREESASKRRIVARSRPRRWAALVNDTSHWYHWGCAATSAGILETLDGRGYGLHRLPISGLYRCEQGPRTIEEFDDPGCFRRFVAANPWIFRELDSVDHVVINGEGSLHGLNPYVLHLLYLAYAARVHLGKDVQIVNHSCYPDDSAEPGESDVWRLYLKVYRTMSHVAIREPVSFALMSRAGIAATQSFDCLPLTVARHGAARWEPRRDDVVLAGSAALRDEDLPPWVEFVERLGATGRRVRVLIGASMYPADDDAGFLHRLSAGVSRPVEIVRAASLADWLDTIAGAAAVVSGRFHYSIAAAALGTPFVLLGSNSPKNLGLAERLGVLPPLPLDAPGLADQLIARVEALGAEGEDPARAADRLAGLCADAEKNFLALPPV